MKLLQMYVVFFASFFLLIGGLQAQLTGRIKAADGTAIQAANVLLLRLPDSSLTKGQISSADGQFNFKSLPAGSYLLKVAMIGYAPYLSQPINWPGGAYVRELETIILTEQEVSIDAVEISAQKQLFEQQIDRMVINVASSATAAGNTALEVLERAPGVILDRNSNSLTLAGKDGVIVMINGKRNYMPISGVIQLLAGMSADDIEKVELITTPPANFDAEGNAGYINIVLKQNTNYGLNGAYSLTAGYGRGERANASLNLNYRRNKFNAFGNYTFLLNRQEQLFEVFRLQEVANGVDEFSTSSDRFPQQLNHNVRLGMDYQLSKKTVLGVLAAGYNTRWTMDALNTTNFTFVNEPDTLILLDLFERNEWWHYMGNVNLQHHFSEKKSLTFNVDYLYYVNENPTDYDNSYFDEENNLVREEGLRSRKETPLTITVATVDYKTSLGAKANLEAGIKGTLSRFTNDVSVSSLQSEWVEDPSLTGIFFLNEEIGGAYVAMDAAFNDKTTFKAGLRYEYTQSNVSSETEPDIVNRRYGNLFPSIYLSRNLADNQSLNLSYSRRISRPTFNQMAPFVIFLDPVTFFSGNAALQPAISDAFKVDYRYKASVLSLSYTYQDSAIVRFQARVDPETDRLIINAENLRNSHVVNGSLTVPVRVNDWWDMQYNVSGTWTQNNALLDGTPLTLEIFSWSGFSSQRFRLPKDFRLEISGFYRSPVLFGTATFKGTGRANVALRKSFGPNGTGGTLTFNVTDILNSFIFEGENNLPELGLVNRNTFDFSQRTFLVSYTRNFGSNTVREARRRKTASDEERRRLE